MVNAPAPSFFVQLKALIKKDYKILSRHKKEFWSNILVPLLSAVIASQVFGQMLGSSVDSTTAGRLWPEACSSTTPHVFITPPSLNTTFLCPPNQWTFGGGYPGGPMSQYYAPEHADAWLFGNMSNYIIAAAAGDGFSDIAGIDGRATTTENSTTIYYNRGMNTYRIPTMVELLWPFVSGDGGNTSQPQITQRYFSQMPQPTRVLASGIAAMLLGGIALLPATMSSAARLVDEKRTKVRVHLLTMGVSRTSYVIAALTWSMVRLTLTVTVLVPVFAGLSSIKYTLPWPTWIGVYFATLLISFSMACFAHLPQLVATRPNISNAMVTIFLTGSAVACNWITLLPPAAQGALAFFLSPVSGGFALTSILAGETLSLPIGTGVSLLFCFLASIGYVAVGEYFMCLYPGEYGVPKEWDFPIKWLLGKEGEDTINEAATSSSSHRGSEAITAPLITSNENPDSTFSPTAADDSKAPAAASASVSQRQQQQDVRIKVRKLTKYYGSQRATAAVDGIDLDIHAGEIFGLLGANGCGKTTSLSLMTGMLHATSYDTAQLAGLDLNTNMDELRRVISICPQFDILFDDLSGLETLMFYADIRGAPQSRCRELLQQLDLPLTDQISSTYSGGMKRRLSLAISFVGSPQIVLLDEPSSGIDPLTRTKLYECIVAEAKRGAAIIMTSHHLQEIELLCDRIAIMSYGKIYAIGTNNELKSRYGVGTYLQLVKRDVQKRIGQQNDDDDDDNQKQQQQQRDEADAGVEMGAPACDINGLLQMVNAHCPATLHTDTTTETTLLLPLAALDSYGAALAGVEQHMERLGYSSFGVSPNSLEDVFVDIAHREQLRRREERAKKTGSATTVTAVTTTVNGSEPTSAAAASPVVVAPDQVVPLSLYQLPSGRTAGSVFDAAAASKSSIVSFFLHIWIVCTIRLRFVQHSPRLILLSGLAPFLLVGIGIAALIPLGGGGGGGSYTYVPLPTTWPDVSHQYVPFVIFKPTGYSSSNMWYPPGSNRTTTAAPSTRPPSGPVNAQQLNDVIAAFRHLYEQQWPGATSGLETPIVETQHEFDTMSYAEATSMAWSTVLTSTNIAYFVRSMQNNTVDLTICQQCSQYSSSGQTSGSFAMITTLLLKKAIQSVLRDGQPNVEPVLSTRFVEAPLFPNLTTTTSATTTTTTTTEALSSTTTTSSAAEGGTTTQAPTPSGPPPNSFIVVPYAIMCVLAIVQFCGSNAIFTSEDLNKGTPQVLRAWGLSGMAFPLGCSLFDLIAFSATTVLAFIVGPIIRNVPQLTAAGVMIPNIIIFVLTMVNVSFLNYLIVRNMPRGLQNGNYLTVCTIVNMLLFALPYVILGIVALATNGPMPAWTTDVLPYLTPLRAMSGSLTDTAPTQTETKNLGSIFACLFSWIVGQLFIIHLITHQLAWSAWWNYGKESNATPSTALLPSNNAAAADIDDDVANEAKRLAALASVPDIDSAKDGDLIFGSHIRKVYEATFSAMKAQEEDRSETLLDHCKALCQPKVDKVAVDDISISLRENQILAVLGLNGSGKSTTVRQLLGEELPTSGTMMFSNSAPLGSPASFTLLPNTDSFYQENCFAVVTQHDSLFDALTAKLFYFLFFPLGCWLSCFALLPNTDSFYQENCFAVVTQHDSLFDALTAQQHMALYLRIRLGTAYVADEWEGYVEEALRMVSLLDDCGEKSSAEFSGGMKRKLQCALSVSTGGMLQCQDEPSTGLDSSARRALYGALKQSVARPKSAALLVTHYLDEAESVANTITILKDGRCCCLGSAQHLRSKFGSGYTITVFFDEDRLRSANREMSDAKSAADTKLQQVLGRAGMTLEVADSRGTERLYTLATVPSLSTVFTALASVRDELFLHSYSVAQTASLEHIFIKFSGTRAGVDTD